MNLPKRICVVDLEATKYKKMYDLGYLIATLNEDTNQYQIDLEVSRVIKQVWENRDLFETAYYNEKRPLYVSKLRGRTSKLQSRGHAMRCMFDTLIKYDVEMVLAFNIEYDSSVFELTSEQYNTINPIEHLQQVCIYEQVLKHMSTDEKVLDKLIANNVVSASGKSYSLNAENTYRVIKDSYDFVEEHTGLEDAKIELEILNHLIANYEVDLFQELKPTDEKSSYKNEMQQTLRIKDPQLLTIDFEDYVTGELLKSISVDSIKHYSMERYNHTNTIRVKVDQETFDY